MGGRESTGTPGCGWLFCSYQEESTALSSSCQEERRVYGVAGATELPPTPGRDGPFDGAAKGIAHEDAREHVRVTGDAAPGNHVLSCSRLRDEVDLASEAEAA